MKMMMDEEGAKGLLKLLQCPNCQNRLGPDMAVCNSGHNICSTCKKTFGNYCRICGNSFSGTRNILLDKIMKVMIFSCKNSILGCSTTDTNQNLAAHEKSLCDFRQIKCFLSVNGENICRRFVVLTEYNEHLRSAHKNITISFKLGESTEIVCLREGQKKEFKVLMDQISGVTFLLAVTFYDDLTCAVTVHYIGALVDSANYIYTIQFKENETGLLRGLKLASKCLPVIEEDILKSRAALLFRVSNEYFRIGNGGLVMSLKIEEWLTYFAKNSVKQQLAAKESNEKKLMKLDGSGKKRGKRKRIA